MCPEDEEIDILNSDSDGSMDKSEGGALLQSLDVRSSNHELSKTRPASLTNEKLTRKPWTKAEKEMFFTGQSLYGKNWKQIAEFIGTRSPSQVQSFSYYMAKNNSKQSPQDLLAPPVQESIVRVRPEEPNLDEEICVDDEEKLIVPPTNRFHHSQPVGLHEALQAKFPDLADSQGVASPLPQEDGKKVVVLDKNSAVLRPSRGNGGVTLEHGLDGSVVRKTSVVEIKKRKRNTHSQPFKLIPCKNYDEGQSPLVVHLSLPAALLMTAHTYSMRTEIMGLLGGTASGSVLRVDLAVPCQALSTSIQCEMDPVSQSEASETIHSQHKKVVGWYHSHPTFNPYPSRRDMETQAGFQALFAIQAQSAFVGIILSRVADLVAFHIAGNVSYELPTLVDICQETSPEMVAAQIGKLCSQLGADSDRIMVRSCNPTSPFSCLTKLEQAMTIFFQDSGANPAAYLPLLRRHLLKCARCSKLED